MSEDGNWFAPKRYGIGPGVPIAWQGWALMIGFLAVTLGLALLLKKNPMQFVAALVPLTITFLVIAGRTTRGGLRWGWGDED